MKKSREGFKTKITLATGALNIFSTIVFLFLIFSFTQTTQASIVNVVNQNFDNATTGTVSTGNGWSYSSTWNGQTIGNHTNANLSTNENSTPWNGIGSVSTIVSSDVYGNESKFLSMNTGANRTFRPLFTLEDTNKATVFEMRFRTPSEAVAEGATNRFIWDDSTNKLWYFSFYAKDPTYGNCLIWNTSGTPTSSSVMEIATNLTVNTWYYIRIIVGGSNVPLSDPNKLAVYFGTSLTELTCIYEGSAISDNYSNPSSPRFRLDSVQTSAGLSIDDFKIDCLQLPEVNVNLIDTNPRFQIGDLISGGYTYTANDGGSDNGGSWTLWRADNEGMINKVSVLSGTSSLATQELLSYTLSSVDIGCYMQLEISAKGSNINALKKISDAIGPVIVWNKLYDPNATAPILIQPINNFNATDVAVDFQWWKVGTVTEYEIQISDDVYFSDPEIIQYEWPYIVGYPEDYLQLHYLPQNLLSTGQWYWRVRTAVTGQPEGMWSNIESFIVNDSHPKTTIGRRVSQEDPMFIFEGWVIKDFSKFANIFPEDIKDNCALSDPLKLESNWNGKKSYMEWIQPAVDNNINYYIWFGHKFPPLSVIEWAFQNNPNVLGIQAFETFWTLSNGARWYPHKYYERLAILCAKYGKQIIIGDGQYSNYRWQWVLNNNEEVSGSVYDGEALSRISPVIMEYGDYFVLQHKANIFYSTYSSEGAVQGSWLAGRTGELGYMPEPWYWADFFIKLGEFQDGTENTVGSSNFRKMPGNFWNQMMLQGMMQGASVFSLVGQSNYPYASHMVSVDESVYSAPFWGPDENGNIITTSTFNDKLIPFIRAVLNKGTIPTKQEVLSSTKVAIDQGDTLWKPKKTDYQVWHEYGPYDALYRNTYGFKDLNSWLTGVKYEIIPNNGRYYKIPLLPIDYGTLPSGIQVVNLENLQDANSVQSIFNNAYPEMYTGDANVMQVGNTISIMSSSENEDITQEYMGVPINSGIVENMSGDIGPHAYIMGKKNDGDNDLWLQTNSEYPERSLNISFVCSSKPVVIVTPSSSLLSSTWDYETKTQSIIVSYENGAAEIALKGNINPEQAIIDNGGTGYEEINGTWTTSSIQGYNGTSTRYSNTSGASVQWTPNLTSGVYRVYIYKVVHSSTSDPNAKIDIINDLGTSTQYIDYTSGSSGWIDLGAYIFTSGAGGYIQNTLNTDSKYIRADAVKFVKEADISIIDNFGTGYAEVTGTWITSSLKGYNDTSTRCSNTTGATVKWTPSLSTGQYKVYIYKVAHSASDPNSKIDIVNDEGTSTTHVDYSTGVSGWIDLGDYSFTNGLGGYIQNTLNTATKYARADAVMFVLISN